MDNISPNWSLIKNDVISLLNTMKNDAFFITKSEQNANDLVNDAIIIAMRKAHQFKVGTNLRAWLKCIMRSHFKNISKKDRFIITSVNDNYQQSLELYASKNENYQQPIEQFLSKKLLKAMGSLSENQIRAVILRDIEEYDYDQLSRLLNCKRPVEMVCKAHKKLRNLLISQYSITSAA